MHVGAWSPSSGPQKAPEPGSSVSCPLLQGPLCPQAPVPAAVLTQAHVLRRRAGDPQGQDHRQQPERSGLHGHGRLWGPGHSEPSFIPLCLHRLLLSVWGWPFPAAGHARFSRHLMVQPPETWLPERREWCDPTVVCGGSHSSLRGRGCASPRQPGQEERRWGSSSLSRAQPGRVQKVPSAMIRVPGPLSPRSALGHEKMGSKPHSGNSCLRFHFSLTAPARYKFLSFLFGIFFQQRNMFIINHI